MFDAIDAAVFQGTLLFHKLYCNWVTNPNPNRNPTYPTNPTEP